MEQLRERRRSWIGFIRLSAAAFGAALLNLFPFCEDLPRSCSDVDKKIKTFSCEDCKKSFSRKYNLQVHSRIHTGERPFSCVVCKRAFAAPGNFKRHEKRVHGKKEFCCDRCGELFSYSQKLEAHMLRHTEENLFRSGVCKEVFSNRKSGTGSFSVSSSVPTENLPDSSSQGTLVDGGGQNKVKRSYKCSERSRYLATRTALVNHLRHSGENPYRCSTCRKSFTQVSTLQKHLQSQHNNAGLSLAKNSKKSDFSQSVPVQFDDKQSVEFVEAEKDFVCTLCERQYKIKAWLMKHLLKIHNVTLEALDDNLKSVPCSFSVANSRFGVLPSVPTENLPNSHLQGAFVEDGSQNRSQASPEESDAFKMEINEVKFLWNENGQGVFLSGEEEEQLRKKVKSEHDLAGSGTEVQSNSKEDEIEHDQVPFDSIEDDQKFLLLSPKKEERESKAVFLSQEEEQSRITVNFEPGLPGSGTGVPKQEVPELETEIVSD